MEQLDLFFFAALAPIKLVKGESDENRFQRFHRHNPHVLRAIVAQARSLLAEDDSRKLSMKLVFELVRRSSRRKTHGEPWKLNNIFTAHYARLVMRTEPDLAGWFELRRQKGEDQE